MYLDEFVGNRDLFERLLRSAESGQIHAFLFTGPEGTGKKSMAAFFAESLLCLSPKNACACGKCAACKQFAAGIHPDFHRIDGSEDSIKIDRIRALLEELALTSSSGGRKTVVIEEADRMTEQAQNAFLKTLENPVGDTVFFLIADQTGGLLKTLLSRCIPVRFQALGIKECAVWLRRTKPDAKPEEVESAAALAQGSPGRALKILRDGDYNNTRKNVMQALCLLRSEADITAASQKCAYSKERRDMILGVMESAARDLMRMENAAEPVENPKEDIKPLLKLGLNGHMLLCETMELSRKLKQNVSWNNAFDDMGLRIASELRERSSRF